MDVSGCVIFPESVGANRPGKQDNWPVHAPALLEIIGVAQYKIVLGVRVFDRYGCVG